MHRELNCLRCGGEMRFIMAENLQLGKTGWILGDLPNLIAGAMEVAVYRCSTCGKIEFFQLREEDTESGIPQVNCPICGKPHDFDYPKCPVCGHKYYSK